jgi:hypothetical protein
MKSIRALTTVGVIAILVLFLFVFMSGSAAVHAGASVGDAKVGSPGVALLADNLQVNESQGATNSIGNGLSWTNLPNMKKAVKQVNGGGYNDGFVYIPGGINTSTGPTLWNTMQTFEVANNRWRIDNEAMPTALADAAICTDNSGRIHVVNGFDSGLALNSVHLVYDPSQPGGSRWSSAAAPQVAGDNYFSQGSGCAFIDRFLYLFGGLGNIGAGSPAPLDATWVWDPMTDSWTDTGFTLNTARYWMGYARKSNNAYVAGGLDGSGPAGLNSAERFSPSSGWQALMNMPDSLVAPGLVGTESGVVVFGGGIYNGSSYDLTGQTRLCAGSCPPSTAWTDVGFALNTDRWFAGYAGGPPDGPFIAGGHVSGNGALKTSEKLQAP